MRYRTKLTIMDTRGAAKGKGLRTSVPVPDSGIYRVSHPQHHLPYEVTLLKDQKFPRCSRCNEPVFFELVHSAPSIASHPSAFTIALYELPELADDESVA